jgi:hypothetical protein
MSEALELENSIEQIEQALHRAVDNDDDQALFIASYLHGHFDLVVSKVLAQPMPSKRILDSTMRISLESAFDNNELVEKDQQQVLALWMSLYNERQ